MDRTDRLMRRRTLLGAAMAASAALLGAATPARGQPLPQAGTWAALREGGIVLLRHGEAPGVGDPPNFRLGDCATQRLLSERGREQAQRVGEQLRRQQVRVGAVWTSRWCRTRDTAMLLGLGPVRDEPVFDSFFGTRGDEPAQTAAARQKLLAWRGPGALVVVTHQVNITALTGLGVASGEGIVLRSRHGELELAGRLDQPR